MDTKTIKGQAWIDGDRLVQEQFLLVPGATNPSYNVVSLVPNIWDDLTTSSGTYKYNNQKNYFFWEYEMTDTENEDVYVKIKYECPKPKEGLFIDPATGELYDESEVSGEYSKYWLNKIKVATENYEESAAIQRKEITFAGSTYIAQDGSTIEVEDTVVKNNDIGDITNLLSLF